MTTAHPPLVADRYRLLKPLGQGGMGRVWKARDEVLRRDVAIKELVPPSNLTADERREMRERLLREARAIARLNHINVVRIFDVLRTDGDPWIVMEYVPSRSLQDVLAKEGPIDPVQAARIGLGVLSALRAAHRAGVMHRDVKPANVLVRPDGVVKLTDFGIARLPESGGNTGGIIPGTGAYMAPEQVRGDALDGRVDLYAAGIVLYEMLCGCTPFETPDRDELALRSAQIEEAPRPIRALVPSLPPAIDVVIARALAKDSRHRYPTALELGDALCTALGLDPGPLWPLAREFAEIARTLSAPLPRLDPSLLNRADHLRTAMMTPLKR